MCFDVFSHQKKTNQKTDVFWPDTFLRDKPCTHAMIVIVKSPFI